MASLLAARGAFAARTAAPVKCMATMRSAMTSRAIMPVVPRTGQTSSFLGGSFAGSSLVRVAPARGGLLVMANAKKSMACTKEGTNRKRRRTSGFKARMATKNGQKVLKARRARGRHVLCPASEGKSGGKK
ncbi:hypothetical protein GPECTOR_74g671 [Gonium pectorale]|uniref:50S ribosomal protein L34, chloroplastic n=1 Tax=Gonium pectorale TaxID=33097 RepID=A0A150G2I1_GONPE|nr:hypothetical protein GPECTOR_74g671 [Gonium pectorale]|eukprot:KXZ44057.1 hypothetical protein GPECTOR_74g671 [Gonium pectorale]